MGYAGSERFGAGRVEEGESAHARQAPAHR
jgi:hypothetical protein